MPLNELKLPAGILIFDKKATGRGVLATMKPSSRILRPGKVLCKLFCTNIGLLPPPTRARKAREGGQARPVGFRRGFQPLPHRPARPVRSFTISRARAGRPVGVGVGVQAWVSVPYGTLTHAWYVRVRLTFRSGVHVRTYAHTHLSVCVSVPRVLLRAFRHEGVH